VEKLSAQYELSNSTGISFVYCNFEDNLEASTYVKVIIKQLCRRMDELPIELEKLYDDHYRNASNPGYTELRDTLMRVSGYFGKVFLVLDALDECTEDQRNELFEVLRGTAIYDNTAHGNLKIFVTSRKEQDIQRAFKCFPVVEIEAKKVNDDIESYVTAQLDQHRQDGTLEITDSLKSRVVTALINQAGGM